MLLHTQILFYIGGLNHDLLVSVLSPSISSSILSVRDCNSLLLLAYIVGKAEVTYQSPSDRDGGIVVL